MFHDYNFQKGNIDFEHGIYLKKCSLITLLQTLWLHFASPKTQTEKKYMSIIKKYHVGFAGKIFGKFFHWDQKDDWGGIKTIDFWFIWH